ncbi:hypothetical protein [Kribbella sp. CA-294648]|uniref:hypothetical protein n=1 Tax=Kribbella sp. CA-294648 TaxID=3239948 RepID=UPI003D918A62
MGRRGWLAAAGVVVVAGCAVAGGAAWRGHADGGESPAPVPVPVSSSPLPTAVQVDAAAKPAVDAILRRRAAAVLKKNEAQFLADVDPRNKKLLAAQKVLFGNLVQFGFAKLSYVPGQPQVKQPLMSPSWGTDRGRRAGLMRARPGMSKVSRSPVNRTPTSTGTESWPARST